MLRINGDLVRVDFPPLQNDELKAMVYEIAPEGKIKTFEENLDVDFGYEVPGVARYRANFFQQKSGILVTPRSPLPQPKEPRPGSGLNKGVGAPLTVNRPPAWRSPLR